MREETGEHVALRQACEIYRSPLEIWLVILLLQMWAEASGLRIQKQGSLDFEKNEKTNGTCLLKIAQACGSVFLLSLSCFQMMLEVHRDAAEGRRGT